MKTCLTGKLLGVSAALALALPFVYPSSSFAQGYPNWEPPSRGSTYSWTDSPDYYGPRYGGTRGYGEYGQPSYSGSYGYGEQGYPRGAYNRRAYNGAYGYEQGPHASRSYRGEANQGPRDYPQAYGRYGYNGGEAHSGPYGDNGGQAYHRSYAYRGGQADYGYRGYRPYPPRTESFGSSYEARGAAAYRGRGQYVVASRGLNLRAGPSDGAPVRMALPGGTSVRVAGPDVSGWWRVTTPYGTGWVYSRYLAPA